MPLNTGQFFIINFSANRQKKRSSHFCKTSLNFFEGGKTTKQSNKNEESKFYFSFFAGKRLLIYIFVFVRSVKHYSEKIFTVNI